MDFYLRCALIFSVCSFAFAEESSYETDRGYREPAVIAPAIVDESVSVSADDETIADSYDPSDTENPETPKGL